MSSPDAEQVADAIKSFLAAPAARERAAAHNLAVVAQRADRATEMTRMAGIYEQLARADAIKRGRRAG